jgi:hypothetical protein
VVYVGVGVGRWSIRGDVRGVSGCRRVTSDVDVEVGTCCTVGTLKKCFTVGTLTMVLGMELEMELELELEMVLEMELGMAQACNVGRGRGSWNVLQGRYVVKVLHGRYVVKVLRGRYVVKVLTVGTL